MGSGMWFEEETSHSFPVVRDHVSSVRRMKSSTPTFDKIETS